MNKTRRMRCLVTGLIVLLVGAEIVSASVLPSSRVGNVNYGSIANANNPNVNNLHGNSGNVVVRTNMGVADITSEEWKEQISPAIVDGGYCTVEEGFSVDTILNKTIRTLSPQSFHMSLASGAFDGVKKVGAFGYVVFSAEYRASYTGDVVLRLGAHGTVTKYLPVIPGGPFGGAAAGQNFEIVVTVIDLTTGEIVVPNEVVFAIEDTKPELLEFIADVIGDALIDELKDEMKPLLEEAVGKALEKAGVGSTEIAKLAGPAVEAIMIAWEFKEAYEETHHIDKMPLTTKDITLHVDAGHEYSILVTYTGMTCAAITGIASACSSLYIDSTLDKIEIVGGGDTKAPDVSLTDHPPKFTASRKVHFSWEASDDQTPRDEITYSYRVIGLCELESWTEWSKSKSCEFTLPDGGYTFELRAKDLAGNIKIVRFGFVVDTLSPMLEVTSPSNNDVLAANEQYNITWTVEDANSVTFDLYYRPGGGSWVTIAKGWDKTGYQWVTPNNPGEYELKIVARDAAGNTNEEIVSFKVASGAPHDILYKAKWLTLSGDFTVYDLPVTVATFGQYKVVFEAIEVDYDQILIGVYKNDEKVGEWVAGVEGEGFSYQMGVFDDGGLIVIILDTMVGYTGKIYGNMIIANNFLSADGTITPKDLGVVEGSKAIYQVSSSKSYASIRVFSSSRELLEKTRVNGDQLSPSGLYNEWEYYPDPYNVHAGGIWWGGTSWKSPNKVEISTSGLSGRMWFGVAAFERAQVNYGEGFLIYPVYLLVNPNKKPVASFDFVPSEPAIGEEITFISSSYDPDGGEVECRWDFGDGTTAVGEVVHHAYGEAGTYKVTLTVVDDEGAEVSTTKDVVISDALVDLVIEPEGGTWKVGDVIQFKAIANYASGKEEDVTMEASWYVDNTSVLEPAKCKGCYIAKSPGIALVTAIYKSVSASVTVYVRSEWIEEKYVPKPEQVSLNHWIENDHSKINATIELICSPCVKYNVSWSKMQKNGNVFTANVQILKFSKSNCSVIGAYRCPVKHTYDLGVLEPGTYIFILKVWDEEVKRLKFNISKQNLAPIADFAYSPQSPRVCEAITFDASSSYDPDGSIVSYEWDFGDGNKTEGKVVTHAYSQAGSYIVTLTVTDDNGATNTTSEVVTVEDWNPWNDPDSDGGEKITTPELQEAIHCWLNDEPAPKTGAEITTERLQEVIHLWLQG